MPTELADMSFEDWLACLPLLFPGIERCGMVHVPSTSGRVLVDGTPWSPKPSWHLYFRVDDPDDFRERVWKPAVVHSFDVLAPQAGVPLGFLRLSKSHKDPTRQTVTAHTPWTIYDPTTCSPERLFYDGQPLLRNDPSGAGPVLTLAPPQVRVLQEGGKLNVAMIPDLAPAQQRAAAKRGVRVERDKKAPGGRLIYTTLVSSTLKLDLPLDLDPYGGGVFTTVRELWLDCAGHTRCQSPYRESTSQAAFLSFHDVTGAPYLVDQGSNTRYELDATDCAGPSPDDFFKALEAWVAANGAGGKIEDTALIKQAADRIKNVVCAAARHGWEQSAVDVLLERLADFMAKPYGMAKSKLSAMFRRDTKKAAKEAAKFASAVDEIDAEDEQHEWLEQMNAEYAVVMLGGSTRVAKVDEWDPCLGRRYIRVMGLADFQAAFMNVLVHAPTLKEPDRMMPLGAWWLRQGGRRQHLGGITLDPTNQLGPEYLNTWKGFSVAPVAGDPSIFLRHLDHLTAGNGPEARAYLERWLAYKVQNPAEQLEVAIVMRGSEGVGKGSLGQTMRRLFGSHGLHISQAEHLVGKFNAHLMDTCLLFADEAFFAGDPKHVSVLKALITESVITIEKKFVDAHQGRNHLAVIMASNSDFVVPAGKDSRRFFCVDVPDTLMGDRDYFNAYWRAVEDQEQLGAFLYYLQNLDLRGFNVRDFPMTEMLAEQKLATLAHEEKWLFEILSRGYVDDPATIGGMTINGYSSIGHVWRNEAATVFLHNNYLVHMRAIAHGRFALDSGRFGRFMNRYFKAIRGQRPARLPSYALGNLEEARTAFAEYHGLNGFDWGEGDEDERPEAAAVTSAARPEAADDWTTCAGCNTMFHARTARMTRPDLCRTCSSWGDRVLS
jgi:hypothetical protein